MKRIVSMFLLILLVVSCKKQYDFSEQNNVDVVKSGVKESTLLEVDQSNFAQLSVANPVGQSSSATPIPGTWNIKQEYLNQYVHFYQMDAKPEYPGNVLCGPTSYMLGAHMIATAKGVWYPSSKTKVGAIYTKLSQSGKFDDAEGMYISDVQWFCNTYDYPVVKSSYLRTSNRDAMKEYIEFYIKSGYPVIATVNIFGFQGSYWSNDLDMTDQIGVKYYISKNGPVGHFILLTGIKINADGSGRIWYKDPLAKTGETRCASYTRILDAMKYNGNNDYYDAVAIFEGTHVFSYQAPGVFLEEFFGNKKTPADFSGCDMCAWLKCLLVDVEPRHVNIVILHCGCKCRGVVLYGILTYSSPTSSCASYSILER